MSAYALETAIREEIASNPPDAAHIAEFVSLTALGILPEYSADYRDAATAIPAGMGNCYAHTEIVAAVAAELEARTFIAISRKIGEQTVHTNCLLVTVDGSGYTVDNAKSSDRVRPVDFNSGLPESRILQLLDQGHDAPMAIGAKSRKRKWHSRHVNQLDVDIERLFTFSPVRSKLVVPVPLGLEVLDNVRQARAIGKTCDKQSLE